MTALGVFTGIQACLASLDTVGDVEETVVAVQCLGHVGSALAELVAAAGGKLIVADLDEAKARATAQMLDAQVATPGEILFSDCDVFAPCAMGAILNDETIPRLRCKVVAGSANNVLESPRHGEELHRREIVYAPDYCVNAGGLIFLEEEILGHEAEQTLLRVRAVGELVAKVIDRAREDGISTTRAADLIAGERLEQHRRNGSPAYVAPRGR